jgi:hypothetical protein
MIAPGFGVSRPQSWAVVATEEGTRVNPMDQAAERSDVRR